MGKTVFIDFDGTLAHNGVIPGGHLRAVQDARANGHRVLLCTGRPKALIDSDLLGTFDGLIGAAGGYVEIAGDVLSDRRFPDALAAQLTGRLDANRAAYVLEAPEAMYAPPGVPERLRSVLLSDAVGNGWGKVADEILGAIRPVADVASVRFAKAVCFESQFPVSWIAADLAPDVALVPSSIAALGAGAGEFYLPDVTKATGIRVVAERFRLSRSDIIAIGDGYNDLEMLDFAGTAVGVAGSVPEVLARADVIIGRPEHEGLVDGFAVLGLTGRSAPAA